MSRRARDRDRAHGRCVVFGGGRHRACCATPATACTAEPEPGTGVADRARRARRRRGAPFAGSPRRSSGSATTACASWSPTSDRAAAEGLRGVTDLGGYDGMLFVYDADTERALHDGGDAAAARHRVLRAPTATRSSRTTMEPCPDGTDATCPTYASSGTFRYALETDGRVRCERRAHRRAARREHAVGSRRRGVGVAGHV